MSCGVCVCGDAADSWSGTTGSWSGEGWSLKAQRFNRSEVCGASGRIGAEEQARAQGGAKGQEDRVRRDFGVNSGNFELAADHPEGDAADAAEQRNEHRLGQELGEDVRASGA